MRIGNVWRSFGHHKKIRATIEDMYDGETAKAHASTCIAKVVRTRWATFEGPERKLLRGYFGVAPSLESDSITAPPMRRALAECSRKRRPQKEKPALPLQDALPSVEEASSIVAAPSTEDAKQIHWAAVFTKALRVDDKAKDNVVELAIDADNLQDILRTRAKHSVEDLASVVFWMKAAVAHISRSPLAHGLFHIQKTKKDHVAYLQDVPKMLGALVGEFADLLDDSALDDEWVWGKVLRLAASSSVDDERHLGREEIVKMIRQAVLGNATDFVRRFRGWGLGCDRHLPWALLDLAEDPSDAASEKRAKLAQRLIELLSRNSLPVDGNVRFHFLESRFDFPQCMLASMLMLAWGMFT